MATTQGPALRAKLFGSNGGATGLASAVAAGQHSSEALRQATDKLAREQATSEAQVNLYRTKLGEAQVAVKKLEEAYVSQINANVNLQGAPGAGAGGGSSGRQRRLDVRTHSAYSLPAPPPLQPK